MLPQMHIFTTAVRNVLKNNNNCHVHSNAMEAASKTAATNTPVLKLPQLQLGTIHVTATNAATDTLSQECTASTAATSAATYKMAARGNYLALIKKEETSADQVKHNDVQRTH